jgi:hypothetical protein
MRWLQWGSGTFCSGLRVDALMGSVLWEGGWTRMGVLMGLIENHVAGDPCVFGNGWIDAQDHDNVQSGILDVSSCCFDKFVFLSIRESDAARREHLNSRKI